MHLEIVVQKVFLEAEAAQKAHHEAAVDQIVVQDPGAEAKDPEVDLADQEVDLADQEVDLADQEVEVAVLKVVVGQKVAAEAILKVVVSQKDVIDQKVEAVSYINI